MSRLSKLKAKGTSNGKAEIKTEQAQTKTETREETSQPPKSRLARKTSRLNKSPVPSDAEQRKERLKDARKNEKTVPQEPPAKVDEEQVPRKSRLSSLGITKAQPERPIPLDEEIEQFQNDLDTLEKMALSKAPELRDGISSVMARMRKSDHLRDYLYENPAELRKALIGFRAQFSARHKSTSERATKKAVKKAETDDFMKLAGL